MIARTLYDKLWESHTVHVEEDGTTLLYVDRHLVHEVTSPQAFEGMKLARRKPWRVSANLAVADHNVPTTDRSRGIADPVSRLQVDTLDTNCAEYGIVEFKMNDARQGIVHVIGPEQGATLPGMTVVCGDSHTSTHGAFACLAFGIGTSEVEHVMATQCLLSKKSRSMLVRIDGKLPFGCTAKDVALAVIGRALAYMGLTPNTAMSDIRIDKVFIGSCTNSRIEDLRAAADVVRGRRKADNVKVAMVVPGSGPVKAQAEHEGLDRIFVAAGF